MSSSGGSPSPSPKSNPSPSSPVDAHKLFKPPSPSSNPNPNPNLKPTNPFLPTPTYQPSPSPASPPLLSHGAFSYPPPTPPFQNRPIIQYPQDPLSIPTARPLVVHHAASPIPNPPNQPEFRFTPNGLPGHCYTCKHRDFHLDAFVKVSFRVYDYRREPSSPPSITRHATECSDEVAK
ncbi:hypothetical protein HPP92_020475 [Vanilla planifolia]|uniref:Uncharacterized protein n=1 Tax=Vanilla planifolia TaxID=51239 RepID=A0A835Q1C2_VANPL|nr:hypothetical protein HPP92_020475 [Vanilla planifolia]